MTCDCVACKRQSERRLSSSEINGFLKELGFTSQPFQDSYIKYWQGGMQVSGREGRQNTQLSQFKDLMRARIENLKASLENYIDEDLKKLEDYK